MYLTNNAKRTLWWQVQRSSFAEHMVCEVACMIKYIVKIVVIAALCRPFQKFNKEVIHIQIGK